MKKIIVISILAIAGLTACTAESPAPTITVTEQAPVPAPPDTSDNFVSKEQQYVDGVRSVGNYIIDAASDAELIEMGNVVCEVLSSGYTIDEVIAILAEEMVTSGNTSQEYVDAVSSILAGATLILCPQYSV